MLPSNPARRSVGHVVHVIMNAAAAATRRCTDEILHFFEPHAESYFRYVADTGLGTACESIHRRRVGGCCNQDAAVRLGCSWCAGAQENNDHWHRYLHLRRVSPKLPRNIPLVRPRRASSQRNANCWLAGSVQHGGSTTLLLLLLWMYHNRYLLDRHFQPGLNCDGSECFQDWHLVCNEVETCPAPRSALRQLSNLQTRPNAHCSPLSQDAFWISSRTTRRRIFSIG